MRLPGQVLIFDADDTLWETNLHFERVVDDFVRWLEHPALDGTEIRAVLADIQRANVVTHGYGPKMFLHSLGGVFEQLRKRPVTEQERLHINELGAALLEFRVELIPGVAETLEDLGTRHELVLLTKGKVAEQQHKVDTSNLAGHFRSVHIVPEKHPETYRQLARELALTPESTWMIGNSPRSDVLPARKAGLNAVFIPNEYTWVLEEDELDPADERVLRLAKFPDLLRHF